ncbi:MAG TPA: CHASE3 domain-containing protein [Chthoniobacterales bacterium]|nr:CHASE3 domain-containing protein [Chthoniobacterales bacterium]
MSQTDDAQPAPAKPRTGLFALVARSTSWLFSQKHFHIKLLSGTAAGVLVIVFLAGVFLFVTYRNHQQETLRTHTIEVMRLSSLLENDIAALETGHRGFLLTGDRAHVDAFERRREAIKERIAALADRIVENSQQRKRVMKVQEIVSTWLSNAAVPEMTARQSRVTGAPPGAAPAGALGSSMLDQARELLRNLQNDEQIVLNERMRDQEWAAQSTQILGFLPKLERSVVEMEKEQRGYLLTGDNNFVEAYKRATAAFISYHGYLSILVANSPEQAALLSEIRADLERWITTSASPGMDAKRAGRDDAAFATTTNGQAMMAQIREKIARFERNELGLFEARSAVASRERIIKTTALAALCLFAVGLLVVSNTYSCVLVRRQVSKLEGVESRINSIIENILDGMITVDEQGVICSMNPAAEKMFGCINNEMVGHNFTKLVPKTYGPEPELNQIAVAWADLARSTGSTTMAVGRTRRHATFPIEISLSEMRVDGQKLFVAMIRDVTERKRFEQQIDKEKESLAVTLRSIGDGVITTDVQGKIIMINKAAEGLTGWPSAEAIGQPLKSVFNVAIDLAAQAKAQRSGYRNEAQSILLTLPENATLVGRDGSEHVIEQVASPIRDGKNEVAGVVLVFRDITERQRNEAERRKAETLEQLGLLAGGIAHDFNNLLTAIIGNISLASLLLPPNDEMGTRLNDAKNASMRARDLAQQLLTFARGGAPIKKTASIGRLIQDTVSFSLRGTHSRSEFTFGADLWAAEIDPGQISQVIANLVVNADQAMPNGGTLRVHCDNFIYNSDTTPVIPDLAPGDYIRVKIRDEGVGIPENYLKRIFDPYFTTKEKGTGLGLATTYSIIKNHHGLITVDSQLHYGSTFTIYLPAARHVELPVEAPRSISPVVAGTGRVLVVDDEEAIRALVEFTLSHLGYEVSEAETAMDGVNLYREKLEVGERFDLVILDLTLPGGMGGKEALKRLIEIDPTVNAIVSSGYAMDATMSRYQDFGFRGVIAKPYEAAELGKVVNEAIQSANVNIAPEFEGGRLASRVA